MQASPEAIAAHTMAVIREIDAASTAADVRKIHEDYQRWAAASYVAHGIREHMRDKVKRLTRGLHSDAGSLTARSRAMSGDAA